MQDKRKQYDIRTIVFFHRPCYRYNTISTAASEVTQVSAISKSATVSPFTLP